MRIGKMSLSRARDLLCPMRTPPRMVQGDTREARNTGASCAVRERMAPGRAIIPVRGDKMGKYLWVCDCGLIYDIPWCRKCRKSLKSQDEKPDRGLAEEVLQMVPRR